MLSAVLASSNLLGREVGILGRLFGKKDASRQENAPINHAFVLLSNVALPVAETLENAYRQYASSELVLKTSEKDEHKQVLTLEMSTGEKSFVMLIPAPVPNEEAEYSVQFSLSRFRNNWALPTHNAHLMVTFHGTVESKPIDRLSRFTALLAAVIKASPAVGVYWGHAGATHDSDFFVSVAAEEGVTPKMMLWSGISIARETDGRLSVLSLGMEQLNLPDLLLVAGENSENEALETAYDMLAYPALRGEPLPEGDTVGRNADERIPVHYVKSPLNPKKKVWRVNFP